MPIPKVKEFKMIELKGKEFEKRHEITNTKELPLPLADIRIIWNFHGNRLVIAIDKEWGTTYIIPELWDDMHIIFERYGYVPTIVKKRRK